MVTKEEIDIYIDKIPPVPEAIKECIDYLDNGELLKASKSASRDLALSSYLINHINKPIYGFRDRLTDISQIFGALGIEKSEQIIYNYMISMLSPKKWIFFDLNETLFYNLQAELSVSWQLILKYLKVKDRDIYNAITLLPSSIIVSEALFCSRVEEVNLIRRTHDIDLNTILKRLCDMDLFDISKEIAKKWQMKYKIEILLDSASGFKKIEDKEIEKIGKWMHLLLFFLFSKPAYIKAGLNDFVDFHIEYVKDIYEDFIKIMDIE